MAAHQADEFAGPCEVADEIVRLHRDRAAFETRTRWWAAWAEDMAAAELEGRRSALGPVAGGRGADGAAAATAAPPKASAVALGRLHTRAVREARVPLWRRLLALLAHLDARAVARRAQGFVEAEGSAPFGSDPGATDEFGCSLVPFAAGLEGG
jgi:hypothetical protein